MKIFYKEIDEDVTPVDTAFSFEDGGETVDVKGFNGDLMKAGEDSYYLRGDISVTLHCKCDRCMKPTDIDLQQKIEVSVQPEIDSSDFADEYEMTDDDGEIYLTDPEFIDLDDILRQEVILQLPLKRLCSNDCAGVEHKEEKETPTRSPLAALEALKNK
ncbi:MAG: DUF177 domain-containing protein [Deferribacteraceae bacterium]|jgi:uncharacterized protein|nr:DUF177 domain-containing protein [Deferribacteraceae bacterium]